MNQLPSTDAPSDIARRINSAADQLYEENGKSAFPNVDAVRRRARVNMNDASAVMRIWRRAQTASAAPLQVAIPDAVQEANQAMLTTVWAAATESAATNLQMAQVGWEQERLEAEACRKQLASAFDSQTEELTLLQRHVEVLEKQLATHHDDMQVIVVEGEKWKQAASAAETKAATAEARAVETSLRADDLKAELSHAHVHADHQRREAKERLSTAELTIDHLREELRQRLAIENDMRAEMTRLRNQADALAGAGTTPIPTTDGKANTSTRRVTASKSKLSNGA